MCMVTFDWKDCDAKRKVKAFNENKSVSWAVVELTESCNFNCIWCYANSRFSKDYMSIVDAKKVIDYLSENGVKQVTCSGGEPLMYPHIKEFVKMASDSGLIVHMNTNGYLLTRKLAKELHGLGLSQIQTNIDSLNPEVHDYIRGKRGSFARAVNALKVAMEVGMTCASQTVLTKLNEKEVVDIFRFARSMEVPRCRVWDMSMGGRALGKVDLRPTNYVGTLRELSKFASETGAINIESGDPLFSSKCNKTDLKFSGGFCPAIAGLYMTISCKGDVYYCASIRKPMYNIFDLIEKEERLSSFHELKLKDTPNEVSQKCKSCGSFESCKGGCMLRRDYINSNLDYFCSC